MFLYVFLVICGAWIRWITLPPGLALSTVFLKAIDGEVRASASSGSTLAAIAREGVIILCGFGDAS